MTELCQNDDETGSPINVTHSCVHSLGPMYMSINTSYWKCGEPCSWFMPCRTNGHLHVHIARERIGFPD